MTETADILTQILEKKNQEVAKRKLRLSIADLQEVSGNVESPRGFYNALQAKVMNRKPAIIAEVKKASPSKGIIRENFQPIEIARDYAMNGATCLSVLTDKEFFKGSEVYLQMAREACPIPVLRKDFMIDPYQVYEARALGADCILLIVAALDDTKLKELAQLSKELGMDVLVEVHNADELQRALALDTKLIGINNRDLRSFETNLQTTLSLQSAVGDDRLLITESGIHTNEDVQLMLDNNIYAFLIGEAFMKADSPGAAMRSLFPML